MTDAMGERSWAEPWDRGRLGGLDSALTVVRNHLNANDQTEPSNAALNAAATALDRLVKEAHAAILDAYPSAGHKPGDHHRYLIECAVCGQRGQVQLSVEPQTAIDPAELLWAEQEFNRIGDPDAGGPELDEVPF